MFSPCGSGSLDVITYNPRREKTPKTNKVDSKPVKWCRNCYYGVSESEGFSGHHSQFYRCGNEESDHFRHILHRSHNCDMWESLSKSLEVGDGNKQD